MKYWIQNYAALTLNYLENKFDELQHLAKSVDASVDFRLSYQQGLLDHLSSIGDLCHRTTRAISVPTASADRLLPQKSVWSFKTRVVVSDKASPAEHTSKPVMNFLQSPRQASD
ncbi:hypothetical protein IF1G_06975 [Cordyceps javanica]|uniref:Uncharacterized protein n=1 Tax=Cordyceps javanica TaxID=43265 RepID=A0A545UXB6_9HYPO|nr:hypothetical protein IF1G_06975 [Cordyceps javanica]